MQVESMEDKLKLARAAALQLALINSEHRNRALQNISEALDRAAEAILSANQIDRRRAAEDGLGQALLQRLRFDEHKLSDAKSGIKSLIELPDPLGRVSLMTELDEGLLLERVSCPLGVLGVVFEARPDALVQIAVLALKSGNASVLKGGSEAQATNQALAAVMQEAGRLSGLPEGWLTLLETREDVHALLGMDAYIDLLIPRGSNDFVQYMMAHTNIPVLGHADGVCHTYIDYDSDAEEALRVAVDAKTQYVAVCNASETILLDEKLLDGNFPERLAEALMEKGVTMFGDETLSRRLGIERVKEWHHEYLDLAVSLKVVAGVDAAIDHINRYGSKHTEAILTHSEQKAEYFMSAVDAGNVFWNCSTRFSDGFRYGFGAEVGVSTSKIHARGPVGLEGLLTYKYKLRGQNHIVADFASGKKTFTHKQIYP